MKKPVRYKIALLLSALVMSLSARADTLVNSFDATFDYAANGILGDTNWDGVYLRFGDIPGGFIGGNGGGNTPVANSIAPFPTFLNLQNVGGDWSGNDDDGFFIYKVVSGDFDVSVQSVPGTLNGGSGFDNRGFNFAGLQVRLLHTNNSGAPYSSTVTNVVENSVRLWRFNEFNLDGQVRISTNGANQELGFPGSNDETNSSRYFRITRVANSFTFFVKTNLGDPWAQIVNGGTVFTNILAKPDWAGQLLQVGIAHASFANATRDAIFDDFQLTSPSVTFPAPPPAPSALVTTATNIGGSLTFSWTLGNPADGSLVVISRRPVQHSPVNGITYNANSAYGTANTGLGGAGEFVVFNGGATSVTVTNLGANNVTYYAAVYEYSGSGASTVYNTATPATNIVVGPGVINNATLSVITTNIPVNGAVKLQLFAAFSTGELSDQSGNASWSSGTPGVATVDAVGTVSGVSVGSSLITATFGPFTPSVTISVNEPQGYADTFNTTNNYVLNGLMGSKWDGLFLKLGDFVGSVAGTDGNGNTATLDSQITDTNGLYMSSVSSTWQGVGNDGPFLFKIVPGANNLVSGDFSAILHINSMNILNGVGAGLMARLFNPATAGPGPNGAEYHVNYWKIQNGTTSIRRTQNGGNTTFVAAGPAAANNSLLMQRIASTNFYFYEKTGLAGAWTFVTNFVMLAASNSAPMQVGPAQMSTTGVNGISTFDNFVLDAAGVTNATPAPAPAAGFLMTLNGNLTMTLSYSVGTNLDGTAIRSVVIMKAGSPVNAQPYLGMSLPGNSVFGDPANNLGAGNYVVYRSALGDTNQNQVVLITGLTPAVTYYAAVYTFTGSGPTTLYNLSSATASLTDGFLSGIEGAIPGGIPLGGVGQLTVQGVYNPGGARAPITSGVTVSSGNTNIIKTFGGVLTGITNGTAPITFVFGSFTNTANIIVRAPTFVDNFTVAHDHHNTGLPGAGWDGFYDPSATNNPIPGSAYIPLAGSGATVADANITTNNMLTITSAGDGWEGGAAGGFFLFKYVPSDFQMAVHISGMDVAAFNMPGLMARAYGATNAIPGAPFGLVQTNANGTNSFGEYWVSLTRFDEFGIGTYARINTDNAVIQNTQPDPGDTNTWLLIVRSRGSDFDFYKRLNPTDPWRPLPNGTRYVIPAFRGKPMQVGIVAGPFTGGAGTQRTAYFENFMLDVAKASISASAAGGNLTLQWPALGTFVLQQSPTLSPVTANWQPVPGVLSDAVLNSVTVPETNVPAMFFRLKQ